MPKLKPPAIDNEQLELLASYGCTNAEIAAMARISVRTLQRSYLEYVDRGRVNLAMSLRRKQTQMALEGNVAMLIWLGKQYLGQSERQSTDANLNHTATITVDLSEPGSAERAQRTREAAAAVFTLKATDYVATNYVARSPDYVETE